MHYNLCNKVCLRPSKESIMIKITLTTNLTAKQLTALNKVMQDTASHQLADFLAQYVEHYLKTGEFAKKTVNPLAGLTSQIAQAERNLPKGKDKPNAKLELAISPEPFAGQQAHLLLKGAANEEEFWTLSNMLNYVLTQLYYSQDYPEISIPFAPNKVKQMKQLQHDFQYLNLAKRGQYAN